MINVQDAISQFKDAMLSAGINPPDRIIPDGKIHRFGTNGKRKDKAGWYIFHSDNVPAGSFGDWRTDTSIPWRADIGRELSPGEEKTHRERMAEVQRSREAEEVRVNQEAKIAANKIWNESTPATEYPYLTNKGIKAHGARISNGKLTIPLHNHCGEICSLQFIDKAGNKQFLTGGQVKGCYFTIGEPVDIVCIAEGFATAASIHEATGCPAIVAFNAGKLLDAAKAIRGKAPDIKIIICADDDYLTEGNPGIAKATEAADAVNGYMAIPNFGENRPDNATDFNDLHQVQGLDSVKECIEKSIRINNSGVTNVTDVTANEHKDSSRNTTKNEAVTDVTKSKLPSKDECPTFVCFDNGIKEGNQSLPNGVWYFEVNKEGEIAKTKICSPLHIDAATYDSQDNNYGRLLRFKTTRGTWRKWAMPMELLKGSGDELRGELLAMGVQIQPSNKARNLLSTYLQINPPKLQMQCALQVGWCGDSFVLPDKVYGQDADKIIFQSGERGHEEYTQAGTLDGWRDEISTLAVKNPILMIAISAAFAAPLAKKCNTESGGFHFVGDSSIGKSSALEAACSVWGGENFKRSWRTTANGLEGAAVLFNDGLLALDEISECDPKEIGTIVYALGNGRGKQRATRSGSARGVNRWRSFVLSTGERSIATSMNEGGFRSKAGQSVRLLDIPTKRTHGIYDELHGYVSGQAISDNLKKAVTKQHGVAGRAFLEKLTNDTQDLSKRLHEIKNHDAFRATEPQHRRAAARFALVGLAGEVATEYGLTGWPEGAAIKSACESFKLWQNMRGKGNDERQQILEQLSEFIERHEDSRFSRIDEANPLQIRDKAGWRETVDDTHFYLFNSAGMQEALKGFDFKRSLDVLEEAGVFPQLKKTSGARAITRRIAGKPTKIYAVNQSQLTKALSNDGYLLETLASVTAVTSVTPKKIESDDELPITDQASSFDDGIRI